MPRKKNQTSEDYNAVFPSRLREIMEEKNITQEELAQVIGKSRQTVSYYSDGSSSPHWTTLVKISEYLEVSIDYLLGRSRFKGTQANEQTAQSLGIPESLVNFLLFMKKFSLCGEFKAVESFLDSESFRKALLTVGRITHIAAPIRKHPSGLEGSRLAARSHHLQEDVEKETDNHYTVCSTGTAINGEIFLAQRHLIDAIEDALAVKYADDLFEHSRGTETEKNDDSKVNTDISNVGCEGYFPE